MESNDVMKFRESYMFGPHYKLLHLKDALQCVSAGKPCETDIDVDSDVEFHIFKCLHVMCSRCFYGKDRIACGPCRGNAELDFKSSYYLSRILELYYLAKPREIKTCHVCGAIYTEPLSRCSKCCRIACESCLASKHIPDNCQDTPIGGNEACGQLQNECDGMFVSLEGLEVSIGECNKCYGTVKNPFTCCHSTRTNHACAGLLFCSKQHSDKHHKGHCSTMAKTISVLDETDLVNEALTTKMKTYTSLLSTVKELERAFNSKQSEVKALQKKHKKYLKELQKEKGNNAYSAKKFDSVTRRDEEHARYLSSIKRSTEELKLDEYQLHYFKRAALHVSLVNYVSRHNSIIEFLSWQSLEPVLHNE